MSDKHTDGERKRSNSSCVDEETYEPALKKEALELKDDPNKTSNMKSSSFQFSSKPSFEDLRQQIAQFSSERNWDQYHQPRNLLLAMMGEVGEVAELFQWKGEVKEGLPDWTEKERVLLGQELSDVLNYLVRLADRCHVDLPKAAAEKILLNTKKYPAKVVYGKSKKYDQYSESELKST